MPRPAALLLAGWLAGCAALAPGSPPSGPTAPAALEVPEDLRRCQAAPQRPPEPLPVRTVEALKAWADALADALDAAIAARDDCRARLGRLNDWISERD